MKPRLKSFLLENISAGQTIAKNAFWLSTSHIAGRLIKAVLLIYAARVLGTSGYGVFSYALSLGVLFTATSDIGIDALLTREMSVKGKLQRAHLATSLYIKLALSAVSAAVLIFVAPLFTRIPEALPLLPIVVLLITFDNLRDLALSITRAQERMQVEAGVQIFTNFAIATLGIAALLLISSPQSLMVAYTIGSALGFLGIFFVLRSYFANIWRLFDRKLAMSIIRDAWPFALLGLLGVIMINTDVIMLAWFKDASEVGLYSAAQKTVQILYVVPAILAAAAFPLISRLVKESREKLRDLLEKTIASTLAVGLPMTFGGIVLGAGLIHLIFGGAYGEASLSFQILLLTIPIVFPAEVIANAVFAYNEQRSFVGFLLLGVIGNVVLNIVLIPRYGIEGSAVATIGAQIVAYSFIWGKMKKINYFRVSPHLTRIIPAAVGMAGATFALQAAGVNLVINIALSATVYFTLLKVLKEPLLKTARSLLSAEE